MTIFEAITGDLYPYYVDDALIEKACIDNGVDAQESYSVGMKKTVAKATIAILRNLVVLASEGNGGVSNSYDVDKLKQRIYMLAKDNGLTDIAAEMNPRPTIEFLPL